MVVQFITSNVDIKDAKKTSHKNPFRSLNIHGISFTHGVSLMVRFGDHF